MRKLSILLCLVLTLCLSITAMAAPNRVVDEAQLLTAAQVSALEETAASLRSEYDIDVVILTVDSLGFKSATEYADDYFDQNNYGVGSRRSGVLFLLSMEDRDWAISTCGNAIKALTDYGQEQLFESISDELAQNDYYGALSHYISELDRYFEAYAAGNPIDRQVSRSLLPFVLAGVVLGLIVAAVVVWAMQRSLNTARAQSSAWDYVTPGSFDLKGQQDIYLYSTTTRVRRPEPESSSGGSSTHHSSSGTTHGGSSGKF